MAGVVYTEITGFDDLQRKITQLAKSDSQKVSEIRGILRQVAGSTVNAVKSFVPKSRFDHTARGKNIQSGNLRKSIGLITGKNSTNPTILVGPRVKGGKNGWYGHMVDQGHNVYRNSGNASKRLKSGKQKSVLARVTNRRTGNRVGFVPGELFQEKGFAATKGFVANESASKVAAYFQKRIDALSR